MEQVEHAHTETHSSLVILTQTMSESPVCPSIAPSLCLYTGVLIIEPQRSLITQREREKGMREKEMRETEETYRERRSVERSLIPLQLKY